MAFDINGLLTDLFIDGKASKSLEFDIKASTTNVAAASYLKPLDPPKQYDLRLEQVTFRYSADALPALDDMSLEIPQGKRIAIVGASGSGTLPWLTDITSVTHAEFRDARPG